jgi:cytochrome c553
MNFRLKLCGKIFGAVLLSLSMVYVAVQAAETSSVNSMGDVAAGQAKSAMCAACHGVDGNSPSPAFPSIAGQNASYIAKQLQDYKSGKRVNALMAGMVAALTPDDVQNLAAFFATQTIKPQAPVAAEALPLVEQGRLIYQTGHPASGAVVAACTACHGAQGFGNPQAVYPALHAQYAAYTELTLKAFHNGSRSNDLNEVMRQAIGTLSEDDLRAVAAYTASMP